MLMIMFDLESDLRGQTRKLTDCPKCRRPSCARGRSPCLRGGGRPANGGARGGGCGPEGAVPPIRRGYYE